MLLVRLIAGLPDSVDTTRGVVELDLAFVWSSYSSRDDVNRRISHPASKDQYEGDA